MLQVGSAQALDRVATKAAASPSKERTQHGSRMRRVEHASGVTSTWQMRIRAPTLLCFFGPLFEQVQGRVWQILPLDLCGLRRFGGRRLALLP